MLSTVALTVHSVMECLSNSADSGYKVYFVTVLLCSLSNLTEDCLAKSGLLFYNKRLLVEPLTDIGISILRST